MLRNRKLILLFGELIIPILGYFWWNWNLYFIFLFMFLDLVTYNVLFFFKMKQIALYRSIIISKKQWLKWSLILLALTSFIFASYTFMLNEIQKTDYGTEIIAFLSYKDMGFAQGYALIPFVVIAGWMSYKTEFLMLKRYESIKISNLLVEYFRDNVASILLILILFVFYEFGISKSNYFLFLGLSIYTFFKLKIEKY